MAKAKKVAKRAASAKRVPSGHVDPGAAHIRKFGVGKRLGQRGRRSPTLVVSGAASRTVGDGRPRW